MILWKAWCEGLYGSFGDAGRTYLLYQALHGINETLVLVNSKKGKKPKKPLKFDQVFPELWEFASGEKADPEGKLKPSEVLAVFERSK